MESIMTHPSSTAEKTPLHLWNNLLTHINEWYETNGKNWIGALVLPKMYYNTNNSIIAVIRNITN